MKAPRAPGDGLVKVGRYTMHDNTIDVYYDPNDESGTARFGWTDSGFIRIVIGGRDTKWAGVAGTALHELMEVSFRLVRAGFEPIFSSLNRRDTGRFRFFLDHDQFTESCQHVGDVLAFLLPDLYRVHKEHTKKGKRI